MRVEQFYMTFALPAMLVLIAGLALGGLVVWLVLRSMHRAQIEIVAERLKNELHESNARLAEMQRDSFLALAGERFSAVLSPVSQKLNEFDALVREMEEKRSGAYEGLREQISGLMERSGQVESAASQLSAALRNPTARGKWGEVQLRRVVELGGMEAYCDYGEQQSFAIDGERSRPDLTIHLPGDACIFVDAKVPLSAYLDAVDAADEITRRRYFRAHADAFKSHVDDLAKRKYHRAQGSADFVVMFVPGEAFLSAACTENPDLIEYGAAKNVYIASPLTLMALLRSYGVSWQHRLQEENAKKIAEAARILYDRVRAFAGHLASIGSSLEKATVAYNSAVGSMETRVLPQGRKIKELASLPDAELPEAVPVDVVPREITALDAGASKRKIV